MNKNITTNTNNAKAGAITVKKIKIWLTPILALAFIGLIIEILSAAGYLKSFVVPAPSAVLKAVVFNFPEVYPHLVETTRVCVAGFLLSIIFSFGVAVLMDGIKALKDILYPLLVASQAIPVMVITPIIVLLMGFGLLPKLFVIVLVCFFPMVINLYEGFRNVDSDMLLLMRSLRANKWQTFRHLKFPSALPSFFAGIKISSTYCVMAAVIAEWQGSDKGLGIYLMRVKRSYNYDKMFATILLIVLLSLLLFVVTHLLQRKIIWWRKDKYYE